MMLPHIRLGSRMFLASAFAAALVVALVVVSQDEMTSASESVAESMDFSGYSMEPDVSTTMMSADAPSSFLSQTDAFSGGGESWSDGGLEQAAQRELRADLSQVTTEQSLSEVPEDNFLSSSPASDVGFPQEPQQEASVFGEIDPMKVDPMQVDPMSVDPLKLQPMPGWTAQRKPDTALLSPVVEEKKPRFTTQEADALVRAGPYSAAVAQELNVLRTKGAKAAYRAAALHAKTQVSISAAKRAEALAKVIAAERAGTLVQPPKQEPAVVQSSVKAEPDSRTKELASKVKELRSRNAREEKELQAEHEKLSATTESLKAKETSYRSELTNLETRVQKDHETKANSYNKMLEQINEKKNKLQQKVAQGHVQAGVLSEVHVSSGAGQKGRCRSSERSLRMVTNGQFRMGGWSQLPIRHHLCRFHRSTAHSHSQAISKLVD
jgi:hypothetical protein